MTETAALPSEAQKLSLLRQALDSMNRNETARADMILTGLLGPA